jgi:hypothetical protein
VQHEWIRISSKLGHDEWHPLGHQAGNKGHVAREPIQLGHEDRTSLLPRCGQRCGKLGPSIEGVGSFAGLDLSELAYDLDIFGFSEPSDGRSLSFQAETRSSLPLS